jgi:hypothetical protein
LAVRFRHKVFTLTPILGLKIGLGLPRQARTTVHNRAQPRTTAHNRAQSRIGAQLQPGIIRQPPPSRIILSSPGTVPVS